MMKKTCPIWANHVSASNWLIGGELATFFTKIQKMMYPEDVSRDAETVSKWFKEHTQIAQKRYKGHDKNCSGADFIPLSRFSRWYINIRQQRKKNSGFQWEEYMFVSKSLIGCANIKYDATKDPPNDQEFEVVDKVKHAKAGYGLFFNRSFVKNECVGLYCGEFTPKRTLADTGYSIDWVKNRHLVIDAGGGMTYPMYFGWHFANNPDDPMDANVLVDDEMRVFTLKDVSPGDEAFLYYGPRRDHIDNAIRQKAKRKRGRK